MECLPCVLCGTKLQMRITKRGKPLFVCDSCGIQLFIRRKQGIKRLEALFRNAEEGRIALEAHTHNFYQIQAILKEIADVKGKIDDIGFFFLSDEQYRTRKLLKLRLENLFQQLEELANKKVS